MHAIYIQKQPQVLLEKSIVNDQAVDEFPCSRTKFYLVPLLPFQD